MREKIVQNESLGNFGFLLDFNQDFLFELAQLAESNLYTNKRLCSVYIRQLTENFFEVVMGDNNIKEGDCVNGSSVIKNKQLAIVQFFTHNFLFEYGKKAFPKFPGEEGDRLECPEGEDNNKGFEGTGTLYVWDMIRRLGNAGSHAVVSEKNAKWLEEKYMVSALQQLCYRMRCYFYGRGKQSQKNYTIDKFNVENHPVASREVFYPVSNAPTLKVKKEGGLPWYAEKMYYTVVPSESDGGVHKKWKNSVNKYLMIRRYEIEDNEEVRNFLLHSQKAYLILQQSGCLNGVAPYSVLADLRNSSDYYVSCYEFAVEPKELSLKELEAIRAYAKADVLVDLLMQFIHTMQSLTKCKVYHRNLSHNSIKLCEYEDGNIGLFIVDFEYVKLFAQEAPTVLGQYQERVRSINEKNSVVPREERRERGIRQYQYSSFNDDTPEEQYQKEQNMLVGKIICNILCPAHLENFKDYDTVATKEEIMSDNNIVWRSNKIEQDIIMGIYEIAEKLINDEMYSLEMAEDSLKGVYTNVKKN